MPLLSYPLTKARFQRITVWIKDKGCIIAHLFRPLISWRSAFAAAALKSRTVECFHIVTAARIEHQMQMIARLAARLVSARFWAAMYP